MFTHSTLSRQVFKAIIAFVAFAAPAFLTAMPEVANLTVGALVYAGVSWLESLAV